MLRGGTTYYRDLSSVFGWPEVEPVLSLEICGGKARRQSEVDAAVVGTLQLYGVGLGLSCFAGS
jgi:hypothetical protein